MDTRELLVLLRSSHFPDGVRCPRCRSVHAHRWGTFALRQRFRCCACRRTFSDLTGTPAAYLKKTDRLPAYAACMARGRSIRASAAAVGVHPSTSFRWRHRLCAALATRRESIGGWIEIVVRNLPESHKGERGMTRLPRRSRWPRSMLPDPAVRVVIAVDRRTRVATGVAGTSRLRPDDLERVLGPVLENTPLTVIAAEGRRGIVARFAQGRGGVFRDALSRPQPRSLVHLETAREYMRRFFRWLKRFSGVATKYLDHYLAWHRTLDAALRTGLPDGVLRWPVGRA